MANDGIRDLLREARCSLSVAEAAAKLSPKQQDVLIKKVAGQETLRLTMRDVQEIKEARSQAAVSALPQELFTDFLNPGPNSNNHPIENDNDPHQWLHPFIGQLWNTLEALERSGALNLRSNRESRRVCEDARLFLTQIKQPMM